MTNIVLQKTNTPKHNVKQQEDYPPLHYKLFEYFYNNI